MDITTVAEFERTLDAGPYAWPGGYPVYFLTSDGEALSFEAARAERALVASAIEDKDGSGGWLVVAADINWEDPQLFCAHTNARIESAYAEDEPRLVEG